MSQGSSSKLSRLAERLRKSATLSDTSAIDVNANAANTLTLQLFVPPDAALGPPLPSATLTSTAAAGDCSNTFGGFSFGSATLTPASSSGDVRMNLAPEPGGSVSSTSTSTSSMLRPNDARLKLNGGGSDAPKRSIHHRIGHRAAPAPTPEANRPAGGVRARLSAPAVAHYTPPPPASLPLSQSQTQNNIISVGANNFCPTLQTSNCNGNENGGNCQQRSAQQQQQWQQQRQEQQQWQQQQRQQQRQQQQWQQRQQGQQTQARCPEMVVVHNTNHNNNNLIECFHEYDIDKMENRAERLSDVPTLKRRARRFDEEVASELVQLREAKRRNLRFHRFKSEQDDEEEKDEDEEDH